MKRSRRLAGTLALLCGLVQPLFGSNVLVGLVSLLHAHGHQVSVLADVDHVDLVISHEASEAGGGPHAAERGLHAGPASPRDHVVHLSSSDAVRDAMRRGAADVRAVIVEMPPFANRPPLAVAVSRFERVAHAPPLPQTVVLRI